MARTRAKSTVPCSRSRRGMSKCDCGNAGSGYGLCKLCPHCGSSQGCVLCDNYVPNPPPHTSSVLARVGAGVAHINITTQPHLRGTAHATAVLALADVNNSSTFIITVSPVSADATTAERWASRQVAAAAHHGVSSLRDAHRAWWHAFWPAGGFVTYEYTVLESLYFLMQYHLLRGILIK
jgi:hypothetical protein|eukprot:SAG25_NODE_286_length_10355_cov_16.654544_2_plen_180_part_00